VIFLDRFDNLRNWNATQLLRRTNVANMRMPSMQGLYDENLREFSEKNMA
jgi:hypothetical protein